MALAVKLSQLSARPSLIGFNPRRLKAPRADEVDLKKKPSFLGF